MRKCRASFKNGLNILIHLHQPKSYSVSRASNGYHQKPNNNTVLMIGRKTQKPCPTGNHGTLSLPANSRTAMHSALSQTQTLIQQSEERRVGKECRSKSAAVQ